MSSATALENLSPEQLARLLRHIREGKAGPAVPSVAPRKRSFFKASGDNNFSMTVRNVGVIETLGFQASRRVPPGPGEVEVEVFAAGLNFRDVMIALGIYPTPAGMIPTMGSDISGKIVALGLGVEDFAVGDDVLGMVSSGFQAFVTTRADLLVRKPPQLTFETAASLPVVFITCSYGLEYLARLSKGERILIHSAAGGVGLAAIQIARNIGAEIFVTVGTAEKGALMRSLGIQHILNSRSLDFVDDILSITGGEGVDVILNSLAGEAIPKGIGVLRPAGRFIELGKRDLMANRQIDLLPFAKGLSFSAVELSAVASLQPTLLKTILQKIVDRFEDGTFKPLTARCVPVSEAAKSFHSMTLGTHIGKIIFLVKGQTVSIDEV
jgi:NADPH:quinone reductase-like Zn-dependent oxidoreductase